MIAKAVFFFAKTGQIQPEKHSGRSMGRKPVVNKKE